MGRGSTNTICGRYFFWHEPRGYQFIVLCPAMFVSVRMGIIILTQILHLNIIETY